MFLLEPDKLFGVGVLLEDGLGAEVDEWGELLDSDNGDILKSISKQHYLSLELVPLLQRRIVRLPKCNHNLLNLFRHNLRILLTYNRSELIVVQECEISRSIS